MSQILLDNFVGSNGTDVDSRRGDSGSYWLPFQLTSNRATIQSDRCSTTYSGNSSGYTSTVWPAGADYSITARVHRSTGKLGYTTVHVRSDREFSFTFGRYLPVYGYYAQLGPANAGSTTGYVFFGLNSTPTTGGSGSTVRNGFAIATNEDYDLTLSAVGTTISVTLRRVSDGYYLNTSDAWQSSSTTCYSTTDSTFTDALHPAFEIEANISADAAMVEYVTADCSAGKATASMAQGTPPDFVNASSTGDSASDYATAASQVPLVGTATEWWTDTVFSVSGHPGTTLVEVESYIGPTFAYLDLEVGPGAGTITADDGDLTCDIPVLVGLFTPDQSSIPLSTTTELILTGSDTLWNYPYDWDLIFEISGVASCTFDFWYPDDDTTSHLSIITGSTSGTLTITDHSTGATATVTVGVVTPPPPTSSFTSTETSGVAPYTVTFTDTSTGGPVEWSWDFGDGNISPLQNPSHTYTSAGTYVVVLTVTGPGGSTTSTVTVTVRAPDPLTWLGSVTKSRPERVFRKGR